MIFTPKVLVGVLHFGIVLGCFVAGLVVWCIGVAQGSRGAGEAWLSRQRSKRNWFWTLALASLGSASIGLIAQAVLLHGSGAHYLWVGVIICGLGFLYAHGRKAARIRFLFGLLTLLWLTSGVASLLSR